MPRAPRYFLGIDSGGSTSRAVVGDDSGRILGRASSGPFRALDPTRRKAELIGTAQGLLQAVTDAAGLPRDTVLAGAVFGMSGYPREAFQVLRDVIACDRAEMVSDAKAALEGATGGGPGVVVVAGTGSMALARGPGGNTARCGGWGYLFGDDGGAFDIVRIALRLALGAEEGWGRPTALADMFLRAAGTETVNDAMHLFYGKDWTTDRIAALAQEVDLTARNGDSPARKVMEQAGTSLADLAIRANVALPASGPNLITYPAGSVFASRIVSDAFARSLKLMPFAVGSPRHDPSVGALMLAYRAAGLDPAIRESR